MTHYPNTSQPQHNNFTTKSLMIFNDDILYLMMIFYHSNFYFDDPKTIDKTQMTLTSV